MATSPMSGLAVALLYQISEAELIEFELAGLLSPIRINGSRYYTKKDCIRIELILKGRRLGFTLKELKRITDSRIQLAADE